LGVTFNHVIIGGENPSILDLNSHSITNICSAGIVAYNEFVTPGFPVAFAEDASYASRRSSS
jgi:hypothetical protein